jgi:Domain of unknown function (DUF4326)
LKPQRVQLRRTKGWRMPPNTVKVDRTTDWGNPFQVDKDGTQEECVARFAAMLRGEFATDVRVTVAEQQAYYTMARRNRGRIKGKNVACWCDPGTPCHADVLLELANRPDTKSAAASRSC